MATSLEAVQAQLDALDRRLAGEHAENREAQRDREDKLEKLGVKLEGKLDALDKKIDEVVIVGVRHEGRIKVIERGGGGVIGLITTMVGALLVEWMRRAMGGH